MHLDPEQLAAWHRDGWLHLPGAVPEDVVAALPGWLDEVTAWAEADGPGLHHFEATDAGPVIARSEDLVPHHPGLRALITDGLVPDLVSQLLGEPAVLFKEKVNYKHPGGGGFAPHQDAPAYRFVDHHVSCMVPVDAATEASGCLHVAPGHDRGLLPNDDGRIHDAVVADLDWRPVEVAPADLLLFDSYTPHRSATNHTDRPRRALYLTYNAASAGDHRTTYYSDKAATFAAEGATTTGERARISISDDFLGRPVREARRPVG